MTDPPHNGPDNSSPDGGPDGAADNGGEAPEPAAEPARPELPAQAGGRRSLAVVAAAVVATAGLVLAILLIRPGRPGDAAGAPRPQVPLADLVVRDGDLAGALGQVVAVPGRPVRLCAMRISIDNPLDRDAPPAPDDCDGFTLLGADLGKLADRQDVDGTVTGYAQVEGRYRAGTLTVTRQTVPAEPADDAGLAAQRLPCPPPPAGWIHAHLDDGSVNHLDGYLEAHPDRYGAVEIGYPDGRPPPSSDGVDRGDETTQVALVGTVLDLDVARRELATVFTGNLCVSQIPHNRGEVDAVGNRVSALLGTVRQITQDSPAYNRGQFDVEVLILDQPTYEQLSKADNGTGIVAAHPWLARIDR
ncbi:MAG TPA: hypothetical protein VMU51_36815 [Mycobacteriales bacterium]|nr:hypothetical protein [Mycobacteriales bacterium]